MLLFPGQGSQVPGMLHQGLEELPRWQVNVAGDRFGGKVLGVHFILTQFVVDSQLIQKASGIGLLCHGTPILEQSSQRNERDRGSSSIVPNRRRAERRKDSTDFESYAFRKSTDFTSA